MHALVVPYPTVGTPFGQLYTVPLYPSSDLIIEIAVALSNLCGERVSTKVVSTTSTGLESLDSYAHVLKITTIAKAQTIYANTCRKIDPLFFIIDTF